MTATLAAVKIRDGLERVFWSFVAAAGTQLTGALLLGVDAWKAAALTGLNAAVAAVLVIARWRLAVLPDPGHGAPGLPIPDVVSPH